MKPKTIKTVKRKAKRMKKELGVPHHKAINLASIECGFQNFKHARKELVLDESNSDSCDE